MPKSYKRRGRGRRARFKRRRSYGRKRGFKRRVRRVLKSFADKKYDENFTTLSPSLTSPTWLINPSVANGTGDNARIGNCIDYRSLRLRMQLIGNAAVGVPIPIRIVVFCWMDYLNSTPSYTDLFSASGAWINSFYNRTELEAKHWKPMFDKVIKVNSSGSYPDYYKFIELNFAGKRLPGKRTYFNSTGTPNHVYCVLAINESGSNPAQVFVRARYTWTDI